MTKRQKWTSQEDHDLQELIDADHLDPKWDSIAILMEQLGYNKNAKQCRERLSN